MKKLAMVLTAIAAALICFAAFTVAPKAAGRGDSAVLTFSTASQYNGARLVSVRLTYSADALTLNAEGTGATDTAWLIGSGITNDGSTLSGSLADFDLAKNVGVIMFLSDPVNVTGDLCRLNFTVKDDAPYGDHNVAAEFQFLEGDKTVIGTETITQTVSVAPAQKVFEYGMSASLMLEDMIQLNVNYSLTDMTGIDPSHFGLLVWSNDDPITADNMTYENCTRIYANSHISASIASRYETTTDGIAAKNLGDSLKFRAYYLNEDGTYSYSRVVSGYSPTRYCYNRITNTTDPNETALMVSILNYGAAAQAYFTYKTESPMNSQLTSAQQELNWDGSLIRTSFNVPDGKDSGMARTTGVSRTGSLALEGAIDYIFGFRPATGFESVSATVYYWKESDIAGLSALSIDNASSSEEMYWDASYNGWRSIYEKQPAKEMFNTVFAYAVIKDASGNEQYSGVIGYSPERFAYINQNNSDANLATLAKRTVIYGNAARTFFGNN
ncbi:MAG: hypothetical protein IK088_07735 [Lachnospiraceae bacterium]|nr:hypothetical protein [Lachnospiraceae bacterium]